MESSRQDEISKGEIQRLADNAKEFLKSIRNSSKAVALTGAGVSTDSGIPDFRSPDGLYSKYDPNKVFDMEYFLYDPSYFYDFARKEILKIVETKPSSTHLMLAKLEQIGLLKAVITQNIDLLHQRAGSKNVIELHGNIKDAYCLDCGEKYDFIEILKNEHDVPKCKKCGGLVKPNIVFFGEMLPQRALEEAFQLVRDTDLMIVMGSSLIVQPAASLPLYAVEHGAKFLIINRGETALDYLTTRKYESDLGKFSKMVLKLLEEG